MSADNLTADDALTRIRKILFWSSKPSEYALRLDTMSTVEAQAVKQVLEELRHDGFMDGCYYNSSDCPCVYCGQLKRACSGER